jgi:hypothetical protein
MAPFAIPDCPPTVSRVTSVHDRSISCQGGLRPEMPEGEFIWLLDIGSRLRWQKPSGVGSRLRVSARGRLFFTQERTPVASVVRLHHYNPIIVDRITKSPRK